MLSRCLMNPPETSNLELATKVDGATPAPQHPHELLRAEQYSMPCVHLEPAVKIEFKNFEEHLGGLNEVSEAMNGKPENRLDDFSDKNSNLDQQVNIADLGNEGNNVAGNKASKKKAFKMNKKEAFNEVFGLRKKEMGNKGEFFLEASTAFFIFGRNNRFRKLMIKLSNSMFRQYMIRIFLVLESVGFSLRDYSWRNNKYFESSTENDIATIISYVCDAFFGLEFICLLVAKGVIFEKYTYFREFGHIWNSTIILASLVSYQSTGGLLEACNFLKACRLIRMILSFDNLRTNLAALIRTLSTIGNVFYNLIFLMLFFSILGLNLFKGLLENRCRLLPDPPKNLNDPWPADPNYSKLCGYLMCPSGTWCKNPENYDFPQQIGENAQSNFLYGILTFDTFLDSFLTNFYFATFSGWGNINDLYWNAFHPGVVIFYSVALLLLIGIIMINFMIAALYEGFILKQKELRLKQKIDKSPVEAKDLPDTKRSLSKFQKSPRNRVKNLQELKNFRSSVSNLSEDNLQSLQRRNVPAPSTASVFFSIPLKKANSLISNRKKMANQFIEKDSHWNSFILALLVFNTVILCMDQVNIDEELWRKLLIMDYSCTVFFTIELMFRINFIGLKKFFQDGFELGDTLIITVNFIEFLYEIIENKIFISDRGRFEGVKALKILRIFKFVIGRGFWTSASTLFVEMIKALFEVRHFIIILGIFLIITSVMARELMACKVQILQDGTMDLSGSSPRINFDTMSSSVVSSILILYNVEWDTYLNDYLRGISKNLAIFLGLVVLIGNIVLMKIFMALFVNKLLNSEKIRIMFRNETTWGAWFSQLKDRFLGYLGLTRYSLSIQGSFHRENSLERKLENPKFKSKQSFKNLSKLNSMSFHSPLIDAIAPNQFGSETQTPQSRPATIFQKAKNNNQAVNEDEWALGSNEMLPYPTNEMVMVPMNHFNPINAEESGQMDSSSQISKSEIGQAAKKCVSIKNAEKLQGSSLSFQEFAGQSKLTSQESIRKRKVKIRKSKAVSEEDIKELVLGKSCCLWTASNPFRKFVMKTVHHHYFEKVILMGIISSCVLLILRNPLTDPNVGGLNEILFYTDLIVLFIYFSEIALKIIAFGFYWNGDASYMRDFYNCLDFALFILTLIGTVDAKVQLFQNTNLRVWRCLRILKVLRFSESLTLATETLFKSFPQVLQIFGFFSIFFIVFAVIGVKSLKGTHNTCKNIDISTVNNKIFTRSDCFDWGGNWIRKDLNYDSLPEAIASLFQVSTTEEWLKPLIDSWDHVGIKYQPKRDRNIYWSIYYLCFYFLGNLILMNMVISILVEKYLLEKNNRGLIRDLSEEQKEWMDIKKAIFNSFPKRKISPPNSKISKFFYRMARNRRFIKLILYSTCFNSLQFALIWHRQEKSMKSVLNYINLFFLILFFFEITIKIIAKGLKKYFKSAWNNFDFFIIIFSWMGFILNNFPTLQYSRPVQAAANCVQFLKVIRLVRKVAFLKKLFTTIIYMLPQVYNIALLLIIVLIIYGLIGVELFCFLKPQDNIGPSDINFRSATIAIFTLVRAATGEGGFSFLSDCVRTMRPDFVCRKITSYTQYSKFGLDGCGNTWGYFYWYSFQILVTLLILNLFIAMLLSASEELAKIEEVAVKRYQLNDINALWKQYDRAGKGFITYKDFWVFTSKIAISFGIDPKDLHDVDNKKNFLKALELPVYSNKENSVFCYKFHDVILSLSKMSVILKYGVLELEPPKKEYEEELIGNSPKKLPKGTYNQTKLHSGHLSCLLTLHRGVRIWKQRKQGIKTLLGDFYDVITTIKAMNDKAKDPSKQDPNKKRNTFLNSIFRRTNSKKDTNILKESKLPPKNTQQQKRDSLFNLNKNQLPLPVGDSELTISPGFKQSFVSGKSSENMEIEQASKLK